MIVEQEGFATVKLEGTDWVPPGMLAPSMTVGIALNWAHYPVATSRTDTISGEGAVLQPEESLESSTGIGHSRVFLLHSAGGIGKTSVRFRFAIDRFSDSASNLNLWIDKAESASHEFAYAFTFSSGCITVSPSDDSGVSVTLATSVKGSKLAKPLSVMRLADSAKPTSRATTDKPLPADTIQALSDLKAGNLTRYVDEDDMFKKLGIKVGKTKA